MNDDQAACFGFLPSHWTLDVERFLLLFSRALARISSGTKSGSPPSFPRNEIERPLRRITVSRSGSNYQEYRVE
jgi:hypothetical protein